MNQTNKWWSSRFVGYLITGTSLVVVLALLANEIKTSQINFAVGYNPFSLLSFAAAIINMVIIYLLLRKKNSSTTTNWFLLFMSGATLLAITEGLQRSSQHVQAALFWQNFSSVGYALLPPIFYLFIVSYTALHKRQFVLLSSILILAWGIISFFAGDGLFFAQNPASIYHAPWGYFSTTTHGFDIPLIWYSLFYLLGTGLLLQFRRTNQNRLLKKQASIFILAFLLPFFAAVITNVIIPAIRPDIVPPLATFVGAFSGILVYYGIRQYRILDLDPQILAQNILDTMSEAVIITRPDMSIESINPEAERLLGMTSQKAIKLMLSDFFSEGDWKQIVEKINTEPGDKGGRQINKSKVKDGGGRFTPVQIAVTELVDDGERMANIIVLSDISALTRSFDALQNSAAQIYSQNAELKKLQSQLIEEKAGVEHVVEVRTKELTNAQHRLKAADKLKTEFIILTSHNLRTPLTIAKGYAEMMSDDKVKMDKKTVIAGLKGGLDRLGILVEDLLAISSIESGDQLVLQKIPIQKVIDPLIKEMDDFARTKNDKFVVSLHADNVKVKADPSRLQGALRNLLSNAFKFTDNGTIELSSSRSGDKLIINVSDTGIGIEASEVPKLFTKFHRATSVMTGGYEGEGVGLYLTKLIVEEHNGRVSCVSKLNKGSTFTIELPCF